MKRSRKPFPETVEKLLRENEMSQRELARRAAEHGWVTQGGSPNTAAFNQMMLGNLPPSLDAMKAVAGGLGIAPETFAEYRLESARDNLNWRKMGLAKALKALGE